MREIFTSIAALGGLLVAACSVIIDDGDYVFGSVATVAIDCGGPDTGCAGGSCRVACNCSEEACSRTYSVLCGRE